MGILEKEKIEDSSAISDVSSPSTSVTRGEGVSDPGNMITLSSLDWLNEEGIEETGMWVFGYGSLCWNPGFSYEKSVTGYIKGFSRKFWQGNTTHRGTQNKPGRVATLIEDDKGLVWGQAFQVKQKEAFLYLNNRECELGGYLTTISTFHPRVSSNEECKSMKSFPVIFYVATPSNKLWMGDSPLPEIANQVVECAGNSGHNVEYVLRLAEFVRDTIPEAKDDHLFTLEILIRTQIKERNLCLKTLMGERRNSVEEVLRTEEENEPEPGLGGERRESLTNDLQYTSRVPSKKLRCVNI